MPVIQLRARLPYRLPQFQVRLVAERPDSYFEVARSEHVPNERAVEDLQVDLDPGLLQILLEHQGDILVVLRRALHGQGELHVLAVCELPDPVAVLVLQPELIEHRLGLGRIVRPHDLLDLRVVEGLVGRQNQTRAWNRQSVIDLVDYALPVEQEFHCLSELGVPEDPLELLIGNIIVERDMHWAGRWLRGLSLEDGEWAARQFLLLKRREVGGADRHVVNLARDELGQPYLGILHDQVLELVEVR